MNRTGEKEFFPGVGKIVYNQKSAISDVLTFKHYDAKKVVMGKTMEEWLRFSVCFWHTFNGDGRDPFGAPTITRVCTDKCSEMEKAKLKLQAAFEFLQKLGVKYWTFHDRDIAPEGTTLEETNKNLDEMIGLAETLMRQTGIKCLWTTCNLFYAPRYMNGAMTNPDAHVVAYAGAQVRKGLEIAKRLGAENFVFWGGRDGFNTLLNTCIKTEMKTMASFMKAVVAYKKEIGYTGQLLVEPKPKEPTRHQYDYDALTVIAFLKKFDLDKDFKLNIEPNHTTLAGHSYEHDICMATTTNMLGSIDCNTGSPDLGWDTDEFPMDIKKATLVMKTIIEQGGLSPGGLNFDAKVRRESTDPEDLFVAHIGAMDTFARGLEIAATIVKDGVLKKMKEERYATFAHGIGAEIIKGTATLKDMEKYITTRGEPTKLSGKQEKFETILNNYINQ